MEKEIKAKATKMRFLAEFLGAMSITIIDAAKATGMSRMTVARWLKPTYDDAPISSLETLFNAYGYTMTIKLSNKDTALLPQEQPQPSSTRGRHQAVRLSFLAQMMDMCGITSKDLADKLGLYYTSVDHMFRADNAMMSRIFQIAEVCNMDIRIAVEPQDKSCSGDGSLYTTSVTIVTAR